MASAWIRQRRRQPLLLTMDPEDGPKVIYNPRTNQFSYEEVLEVPDEDDPVEIKFKSHLVQEWRQKVQEHADEPNSRYTGPMTLEKMLPDIMKPNTNLRLVDDEDDEEVEEVLVTEAQLQELWLQHTPVTDSKGRNEFNILNSLLFLDSNSMRDMSERVPDEEQEPAAQASVSEDTPEEEEPEEIFVTTEELRRVWDEAVKRCPWGMPAAEFNERDALLLLDNDRRYEEEMMQLEPSSEYHNNIEKEIPESSRLWNDPRFAGEHNKEVRAFLKSKIELLDGPEYSDLSKLDFLEAYPNVHRHIVPFDIMVGGASNHLMNRLPVNELDPLDPEYEEMKRFEAMVAVGEKDFSAPKKDVWDDINAPVGPARPTEDDFDLAAELQDLLQVLDNQLASPDLLSEPSEGAEPGPRIPENLLQQLEQLVQKPAPVPREVPAIFQHMLDPQLYEEQVMSVPNIKATGARSSHIADMTVMTDDVIYAAMKKIGYFAPNSTITLDDFEVPDEVQLAVDLVRYISDMDVPSKRRQAITILRGKVDKYLANLKAYRLAVPLEPKYVVEDEPEPYAELDLEEAFGVELDEETYSVPKASVTEESMEPTVMPDVQLSPAPAEYAPEEDEEQGRDLTSFYDQFDDLPATPVTELTQQELDEQSRQLQANVATVAGAKRLDRSKLKRNKEKVDTEVVGVGYAQADRVLEYYEEESMVEMIMNTTVSEPAYVRYLSENRHKWKDNRTEWADGPRPDSDIHYAQSIARVMRVTSLYLRDHTSAMNKVDEIRSARRYLEKSQSSLVPDPNDPRKFRNPIAYPVKEEVPPYLIADLNRGIEYSAEVIEMKSKSSLHPVMIDPAILFANDTFTPNEDLQAPNMIGTIRHQYDWTPTDRVHEIEDHKLPLLEPLLRFISESSELQSTKDDVLIFWYKGFIKNIIGMQAMLKGIAQECYPPLVDLRLETDRRMDIGIDC